MNEQTNSNFSFAGETSVSDDEPELVVDLTTRTNEEEETTPVVASSTIPEESRAIGDLSSIVIRQVREAESSPDSTLTDVEGSSSR